MTGLIYSDERMDKAVAFCWEVQRMFAKARYEGWPAERVKNYVRSYSSQFKCNFPRGVRSSAHAIFMDELNKQLELDPGQRDKNKPVWLNEQLGMRTQDTNSGNPAGEAAGAVLDGISGRPNETSTALLG